MEQKMIRIGKIINCHGVKGELVLLPLTDGNRRFKKLKQVFLDTGKEPMELQVTQARFFKNLVILKFKEFDNINDVEKYKSRGLYVTRENAVKLAPNEYFVADLIGLKAVGDDGEDLGEVKDVLQTGANDIYVLHKDGEDDILLPAIKDCVKNVNIEEGTITVHLLNGLRDINKK